MWKLVVTTAIRSNVQVVATAHCYDCIQGLAALLVFAPKLAPEVSVQKTERSLPAVVNLDSAEIQPRYGRVSRSDSVETRLPPPLPRRRDR